MSPIQDETLIVEKKNIASFRISHNKRILEEVEIGKIFIVKLALKKEKSSNSNVAFASMITAKARIKLYRAFLTIIKNDGRLLYCDTDSIFAGFYKNMDNKQCDEIF